MLPVRFYDHRIYDDDCRVAIENWKRRTAVQGNDEERLLWRIQGAQPWVPVSTPRADGKLMLFWHVLQKKQRELLRENRAFLITFC